MHLHVWGFRFVWKGLGDLALSWTPTLILSDKTVLGLVVGVASRSQLHHYSKGKISL